MDKQSNASATDERNAAAHIADAVERLRELGSAVCSSEDERTCNEGADLIERLTRERDENEGAFKVWRRRCWEAERERDGARLALQELMDWQNGPPLTTPKWERGWNNAMQKARAALGNTDGTVRVSTVPN